MRCSGVSEVRTSLQQVSISLCIRIYGVHVCCLACLCWRRPHGLHAGPQPELGGSEDDVVSGDVASDSSDVDVLGELWLTRACCSIADIALLVYVNKGGRSFKVECGNTRKSAHPPVWWESKMQRPWADFRESTVTVMELLPIQCLWRVWVSLHVYCLCVHACIRLLYVCMYACIVEWYYCIDSAPQCPAFHQ